MNQTSDVIIVGGGVIGLLTARELRADGLSVTLLERNRVGMASSQAGGGILAPIPPWDAPPAVSALTWRSIDMFPGLAAALGESTGIDIEYLCCGILFPGAAATPTVKEWAEQAGQTMEVIDAPQLLDLEPHLNDIWHSAIWLPDLGQLRNPRFTRVLHLDIEKAGVAVFEQTPVTEFLVDRDTVSGVRTPAGQFNAPRVIVAAGAWTTDLLGELSAPAIEPVRGQMLWYALEPGTFCRIVIEQDQYLIPRRDGVCLVGSTVERVGFDDGTTAQAGAKLEAVARRLSPVFGKCRPAGQWSGLRPGARDGIPIISAHPEYTGLFIHAGHFRNGINTGPAAAGLMADIVLGREPRLDPEPYTGRNRL